MDGIGIGWTICKSFAPHSRQISTEGNCLCINQLKHFHWASNLLSPFLVQLGTFASFIVSYFALVWLWSTVMSMSVCLFICLSVSVHNLHNSCGRTSLNFCACCLWLWFSPPLKALRYVMYFRFYGYHVFIPCHYPSIDGRMGTALCGLPYGVAGWCSCLPGMGHCGPPWVLCRQAWWVWWHSHGCIGRAGCWLSGSWTWLLPGRWCTFHRVLKSSSELLPGAKSAICDCFVCVVVVNVPKKPSPLITSDTRPTLTWLRTESWLNKTDTSDL